MTIKKRNLARRKPKQPWRTNFETSKYREGDFVEELDCTYGEACNLLRKSWIKLRIARGRYADEIAEMEAKDTINKIQYILGIPVTIWLADYDKENKE